MGPPLLRRLGLLVGAILVIAACDTSQEPARQRSVNPPAKPRAAPAVEEPTVGQIAAFAKSVAESPAVALPDYQSVVSTPEEVVRLDHATGEISGVITGVSLVTPPDQVLCETCGREPLVLSGLDLGVRVRVESYAGPGLAGLVSGSEITLAIPVWFGKAGPLATDALTQLVPSISRQAPVGARIVAFVSGTNPDGSHANTNPYATVIGRSDGTGLTTLGPGGSKGPFLGATTMDQLEKSAVAAFAT